jgi:3-deoxy-D-manno-octulosonic-acid transferase
MDTLDAICLVAAGLAGAVGRGIAKSLPDGIGARLGAKTPPNLEPGWVWLHAVSVGELLLAAGVLGKLRGRGCRVHVTTGTPAGLELLESRLPSWNAGAPAAQGETGAPAAQGETGAPTAQGSDAWRVTGGCFPFEDAAGLSGFLETPPGAFVSLETEIWPNLFRELEALGVPICIVNGRITEKTAKSPLGPFLRRAASRLSLVAARDPESAARFSSMGAPNVALCGNLKADLPPPPPLHAGWEMVRVAWRGCPVLVAGNTVEGEEEMVFAAWGLARERFPGLRLIVAPRQPKRFDSVACWMASRAHRFLRASQDLSGRPWHGADALLLDTMGELASAYRLGSVAIVGGGWRSRGGHNPLEPLRWGVPTIIGPGFSNFEDIVAPLLESCPLHVADENGLPGALAGLLAESGRYGQDGRWIPAETRRADLPPQMRDTLQKTWERLLPYIP